MIAAFNKKEDAPFVMRLGVPFELEAVAAKRADRPVFRGELNPIFQGTYSSRIELKAWMRVMERKLVTAETLGAPAHWLGAPFDDAALWRAWEPVHSPLGKCRCATRFRVTNRDFEHRKCRSATMQPSFKARWGISHE